MRELSQQVADRSDTTACAELVVGRGQVEPDPSRFASSANGGAFLAVAVVMAVAVASRFVFGTLLADRGDSLQTTAATALVMGVGLVLAGRGSSAGVSHTVRVAAVAFGALVAAVVPFIALSNQHSDAPSGTLVLFWTTVVPGALLLVAGLRSSPRSRAIAGALALAATAAAAGILGNWERPSSFSLLTKHVPEQLWLGAAAVLWVGGIVALGMLARSASWGVMSRWAGIGAIATAAVLTALSSDPSSVLAALLHPTVIAFALANAVVTIAAPLLVMRGRVTAAVPGLLGAPTLLSLLIFVEAAVGVFGPEPILRVPVVWGSLLVVAALTCAWLVESGSQWRSRSGTYAIALRSLGISGVALGAISLASAGVDVAVQGRLPDTTRFAADFTMAGFETVGAWIALSVALVALVLADRMPSRRVAFSSAVVALVGAGAWKILGYTPLHVWVTWIPPEVQQDYGTEYASVVFEPAAVGWQIAAVIVAVAVALVVAVEAVRSRPTMENVPAEESGVS